MVQKVANTILITMFVATIMIVPSFAQSPTQNTLDTTTPLAGIIPTITIQFPTNGTTLRDNTFQINGTASDSQSGIAQVGISIDGGNGTFKDTFVQAGSGGLDGPTMLTFNPTDDNLYVSSVNTDEILRYNGTTGTFIDAFVTAGSGGLNGPLRSGIWPI